MRINGPHSRQLRTDRRSQPGSIYFLTTSTAGRRSLFLDDACARRIIDVLQWMQDAQRFAIDAVVVMPDHLHIAGRLVSGSLAGIMLSIKSYSANILTRHGIRPPIWQPGYHDHCLRCDEDYRLKLRYLIENPVRAGLVRCPQDYPYLIVPDEWIELV